ncbi:MAG: hypothetical protein ACFFDT_26600 [Candidatus Hodarchaeota archaeon]
MNFQFNEPNHNELEIIRSGSKLKSLFFGILGIMFQTLFIWGYWSFLDNTGPWAFLWLGLINSEWFPFISILFLFGGGCFLIAAREIGWIETWIIKKELIPQTPGIRKRWQFFRWSREKNISKDQIYSLRIHTVPLDRIKLFNRYQLEIGYLDAVDSTLSNLVIYTDETKSAAATTLRLAQKIKEILEFPNEIERTEASNTIQEQIKKRRGKL